MLKKMIGNREKTIGMHVNSCDTTIAKIIGCAGYDFIWLDMEHNCLSYETLLGHIRVIQSAGTAVIVRAPQDDLTATKKILEMGPDGIIFPMVKTAAQAKRLIDMTLYPPYGNRGFGPMNAVNYGYENAQEYAKSGHLNICRFVQIEHKEAVENLEELMQVSGIDGYIFGPWDLSASYHMIGDIYAEELTAVMKAVVQKLHQADKYVGISVGDIRMEALVHWRDMGIDMISAGVDYDYVRVGALENKDNLLKLWNRSQA